jgi:hypothetical protein
VYWRKEVCPHRGREVLLRTVGGICVKGQWYGKLGEAFTAWCPLPKDGAPPAAIFDAPLRERLRFAFRLIFHPGRQAVTPRGAP